MNLQRIVMASNQAMTENVFTFPVNPTRMSIIGGLDQSKFDVIDDAPVSQIATIDTRLRSMSWIGFPYDNAKIAQVASKMREYLADPTKRVRYINLMDIDYISYGTKKILIWDFIEPIRDGGPVKYDTLELQFYFKG